MKKSILFLLVLCVNLAGAQSSLPVIKAQSKMVDIRLGDKLLKDYWTIMPEMKPDVYALSDPDLGKTVTFITDMDSISVKIGKDTKFDFIILLNGKDTALTRVIYREPYIKILKKAYLYDTLQNRPLPAFTYLDSIDVRLKNIRKAYNLDSVAGKGNEISRLLNVMHWVHNIVRHDGNSKNPALKNAIDLVNVCRSENRGVNCRMMATILNECYLSMGIKSRMVTCMPKPLEFNDCHVINAVFSNQLGKWVWIDPTFDAYVMDEKGILLGIQEVRERLINDKPLILNPEANWNRESSQTKEWYLYKYMAKNLYRLEVPAFATFNTETVETNKTIEYIQLLPLDGINQTPIIEESTSKQSKMHYKTYITNNPKQFWR